MKLHKIQRQAVDWYSVKSATNGEPAEIFIYDEIGGGYFGEGITPAGLINDIKKLGLKDKDTLNVRINSPGGNMFDGNTIYNYLRGLKQSVIVTIDGIAASAASIIAMAGDKIRMPENSYLMIHNPWMLVAGDANLFRKTADDLDEMREGAIKTYLRRSNGTLNRDELVKMLDAETWLSADKSYEIGFADEVIEEVRIAALAKFKLDDYFDEIPSGISNLHQQEIDWRNKQREIINDMKNSR